MATNMHPSSEQFLRVLGEAVVRIWSLLPPEVQHHLFEEATSHESKTRSELAVFLHEKHPRTSAALRQQAITEPDSLGG